MTTRRFFLLAVAAILPFPAGSQTDDARQQLSRYLNEIGFAQLRGRAEGVARIRTKDEAERRRAAAREKILKLIGGLPDAHGAVPVRSFGNVSGDGFHVERIAYESLPGLFVTANVYVPGSGAGPFPAVLLWPGHEATGKLGQYNWGANLARAGILAMAVDPMGQGERLQHYDPELEESKVGQGTGEHGVAAFSTLLIGDHVSRYFIKDGMRGVDYLTSRKDVDGARIGAFGCSGGGVATAYLAALDDRIRVAASACYITSFEELLPSRTGVQEAEQSIPRFIANGFDLADWVELAAPKPYAIISTTEDMFPFAGARQTYEEAKRIYALYGAEDRLQWITGPGGHGALGPISPQILAFLMKWLKGGTAAPDFREFRPANRDDLLCTPTGQVSTSLGGETVESINRKRAQELYPKRAPGNLAAAIRRVTAATAQAGPPPEVRVVKSETRDGYRVETVVFASEPGIELAGLVAAPQAGGRKPAVLLLDSQAKEKLAAGPDFARLARSGHVVFVLQPRGTPGSDQPEQSILLGPFNHLALRAMLVGKTLPGMRIDDTIRAVNWLVSRPDVDPTAISVYGNGPLGVVALHAAAMDSRIARVVVENTLTDYRRAIEQPLHRNLPEIALPGVLREYDLTDLVRAIAPRTVTILNPVDAMGHPI